MVQEWFKHSYNGVERLFGVGNDGYLWIWEEGFMEEVEVNGALVFEDVWDEVVSRGYGFVRGDDVVSSVGTRWGCLEDVRVRLGTWNPTVALEVATDGVNEVRVLEAGLTRDRTKRMGYAQPRYDTTNVDDDYLDSGREDYSWNPGASEVTNFDGAGIDPELHQEWELSRHGGKDVRGRWVKVRVKGRGGRVRVMGAEVRLREWVKRGGIRG